MRHKFLNLCLMKKAITLILLVCSTGHLLAQKSAASALPPALNSIKEADIKTDIFELAGDAFRGRKAGSLDEMRAAAWVAQKAQKAGLEPAAEDGTFFQFFNILRKRSADRSTFQINNQSYPLWTTIFPTQPMDSRLRGTLIWLNSLADTTADLNGKIVAMQIIAPNPLPAAGMSLWGYRYTASAIRQQSTILRRKGAKAVILVADQTVEASLAFTGHNFEEGSYQIENNPTAAASASTLPQIPIILVTSRVGPALQKPGAQVDANFILESFKYPSVNVVAKAKGTDPKLNKEYVLFSGHHDHDGTGNPIDQDSIWNGADDNASVTVGMLAIGRAWKAKPGKRSALFVWHGAEERGLLGSKYFVQQPTVSKESIVAVLNADMIGRNAADSAALLGSTAPHKNSDDLVNMAMKANASLTKFKIDVSWDDAKHPEGWYFRSDHLPYAQAGIPAIFFTTLLHAEYHTPKDEAKLIDINKLAKMSKWMYATGWMISETAAKPVLDAKAPNP
jgi:hypothetical protein